MKSTKHAKKKLKYTQFKYTKTWKEELFLHYSYISLTKLKILLNQLNLNLNTNNLKSNVVSAPVKYI